MFASPRVKVGRFRRHPSEPDFESAGAIDAPTLVFPRLAVRIAQSGRPTVVADPSVVMLYSAGQEYVRAAVSPEGDRCDWFAFTCDDVAAAMRPAGAPAGRAPRFARPSVPAAASLVFEARSLFLAAATPGADPLALEEGALAMLGAALAPLRGGAEATRGRPASWNDLAAAAQELLSRRFRGRVSLSALAAAVGCSPFHLCRAFRAATGWTVHGHLTALRLRAALDELPDRPGDAAALALELGFSHHAHLAAAFRRAFGVTPSEWSRRVRRSAVDAPAPAPGPRGSAVG
ncbi:MAG: AraC family transcriptional regulator [Anaeromyxobacter sp.]